MKVGDCTEMEFGFLHGNPMMLMLTASALQV